MSALFAEERKDSDYRVTVNNVLEITVYGEPDMTKTVRVDPEGKINYPLLGAVEITGLTVKELEERLTDLLNKDYLVNPQVSVYVKEFARISVLGQVKNPGIYELRSGLTAVEAIALAGGLTDTAAANGTKVIRVKEGKKKIIQIPVGSILNGGDKSKDISLYPDDTIVVPESFL